jgi:hypothetical protein
MQLVEERELPDEGPFDPPFEVKAGEFLLFAIPVEGEPIKALPVTQDQTFSWVERLTDEKRVTQLLWPSEPQIWRSGWPQEGE